MNKNELLEKVSLASGLTKKESEAAINAFLETLTDVLKAGDKISLKGFGTFEVRTREARTGRNPRTGAPVTIPARTDVKIKAGSKLKDALKILRKENFDFQRYHRLLEQAIENVYNDNEKLLYSFQDRYSYFGELEAKSKKIELFWNQIYTFRIAYRLFK